MAVCDLVLYLLRPSRWELQRIVWNTACVAPPVVLYLVPLFSKLFKILFPDVPHFLLKLDKYLASSRHSEILQGLHLILAYLFGYPDSLISPCLDTLHHCEIFGVCRVFFSKHSFFAVQ